MANPFFQFKQFTVFHDKCAMKVGVDGVTLGAWTDISDTENILDVGTGSGLIALMLAQRSDAKITAIDIDNECIMQAKENFERSLWKNRIEVFMTDFQSFACDGHQIFDLIVCNPPFFINSLKSPNKERSQARHNDALSQEDLILYSKKTLSEKGRLSVILPVVEGNQFIETAEKNALFCSKKVTVFPNDQKPSKRLLLEFRKEKAVCEETEITIEKERNIYTPEYTALVKDFYLKF